MIRYAVRQISTRQYYSYQYGTFDEFDRAKLYVRKAEATKARRNYLSSYYSMDIEVDTEIVVVEVLEPK